MQKDGTRNIQTGIENIFKKTKRRYMSTGKNFDEESGEGKGVRIKMKPTFKEIIEKFPELFSGVKLPITKKEQEYVVNDYVRNFLPFYEINLRREVGLCVQFGDLIGDREMACRIMTPFYSCYSKKSLPFAPRRTIQMMIKNKLRRVKT